NLVEGELGRVAHVRVGPEIRPAVLGADELQEQPHVDGVVVGPVAGHFDAVVGQETDTDVVGAAAHVVVATRGAIGVHRAFRGRGRGVARDAPALHAASTADAEAVGVRVALRRV